MPLSQKDTTTELMVLTVIDLTLQTESLSLLCPPCLLFYAKEEHVTQTVLSVVQVVLSCL
jgi:hypothetical protein